MRKVHSTDFESSSQIPTWFVLVVSGIALVMFFGWILKDLSALVSPDQAVSRTAQQLTDSQSVSGSDLSGNLNELANVTIVDRVDRRVSLNSSLSLKSDKGGTIQSGKPAADSTIDSTGQPIQGVDDQSANGKHNKDELPASSDPMQQAVTQDGPARFNYQQPSVKLPPSEQNGQLAAMPEPEIITDEIDDDEAGSSSGLSVEPESVALSQNTTAQTDNVEPAKTMSANPELSHTQSPSADLEALRQLIAEATAINVTDNENALATRKRSEALESLNELSAAIQFAPGSKVASKPVITALKQIEMILTEYPNTMISVLVATNESGNDRQDLLLSQERGRTLIAKLVNGGVEFSRFSLQTQTDDQLPANTHKVAIQAHLKS